jgi:DNA polymerase elongation subunit (family B)
MRTFVNGYLSDDRVVFLYRDEQRVLRQYSIPVEYAAFLPGNVDGIKPGLLDACRQDRRILGVKRDGKYWRLRFRDRWERVDICKAIRDGGVPIFEGDVDPVRRAISDYDLHIQKPRRLYCDIEADSRVSFREATEEGKARILVIGARNEEGQEWQWVLPVPAGMTLENCPDPDADEKQPFVAEMNAGEAKMLREFLAVCEDYDQILAWNGAGYDFPVFEKRMKMRRVAPKDFHRWLWLDQMEVFKRNNKNAAESGEEKTSNALQAVAMSLLGHGKDDFDASRTWEAWVQRNPVLATYNTKDVALLPEIEQRNGYVELFQSVCEACRVFPDTWGLFPTRQMDGFMLRLGVERGYRFPTKFYKEKGEEEDEHQFRGAFVLHPKLPGILRGVHVGDFAAMYPGNIVTWNMSPETKIGNWDEISEEEKEQYGWTHEVCIAPTTRIAFRTDTVGILPFACMELMRLRKYWRDKAKEYAPGTDAFIDCQRKSTAYKVVVNSFYGVTGSRYSRFFDEEIAESVTQTGVWLIKHVMALAEGSKWGMQTVYGDTDSLMINGAPREKFDAFIRECNEELLPRVIVQTGVDLKRSIVKIEYEKMFRRIVFGVGEDGKLKAKKYVGVFEHYKGKAADEISKPEVKGYEWRRGDWNVLARTLQRDAIMYFAKNDVDDPKPFLDLVMGMRDRILNDAFSIEVVQITKSLSKGLDEYKVRKKNDGTDCAAQPHIALARKMLEQGKEVRAGTRIAYVIVDGSKGQGGKGELKVVQAEHYDGTFDRFYMWEKLVYPATMRFLMAVFPNVNWKQYLHVRPKPERKPRVTKAKAVQVQKEQQTLPVRAPVGHDTPYRIEPPRRMSNPEMDVLMAVLARFPGRRPVHLCECGEVVAELAANVSVTPALTAAVSRFLSGITDE